ncbi:MAG: ArsB/NhaD family transporter [Candidatus Dormibacteria bacterium]
MTAVGARPAVAIGLAVAALLLVLTRPRGLAEGVPVLAAAALMVVSGVLPARHALNSVVANANILLFFAGILAVAGLSEEAGIFDAVARSVVRLSRGSPRRLLLGTCLAGTLITAVLSNDATALILTPVIALAAQRAGLDPIPFALATSYIADAASGLLPVANPVNILTIDSFHVALADYARVIVPAAVAVAVATIVAARLILGRRLPRSFPEADPVLGARPGPVPAAAVVLALLAVAYVLATAASLPTGVVAVVGAAALATVVGWRHPARLRRLRTDVSWSILAFVAGLVVIATALDDTGVTASIVHAWLGHLGGGGAAPVVTAYAGAAAGSNVVNNLPMIVLTLHGLHATGGSAIVGLGAALGADVGPNLTPIGSLATLLWLTLLRARGVTVSASMYLRYGLLVGLPGIIAGAAVLALTSR